MNLGILIFYSSIIRVVLLVMPLMFGIQYSTQSQNKDFQSWNAAIIDWNFYSSWLFELELDYNRLLSEGPVWREYAAQPSLEYYPNNSIDIFAGVYLTNTKQNDETDTKEVRPLLGFRWNIIKPAKRVFLRTQVKFEYRFFTLTPDGTSNNGGRMRIRVDLYVPITQKSYNTDKNLYGIIWSEAFVNFENEIEERFKSSFRQYLGLGYRFSYTWRLELNYVFQLSRDSTTDELPDNLNNVIFATVKYYITR